MRPGQQNRRMRGRGNNNRKGPNPLSRNYESNGPDVKIRGNAQHIAEKYMTLARDAQATGDRIIAENYLQHAEHYNRIILAAQAQNPVPVQRDDSYDDESDDDDATEQNHSGQAHQTAQQEVYDGSGPQPVIDGTPAEVMYGEEHGRSSGRGNRQNNNRQDRNNGRMQRPRRHQRGDYSADQSGEATDAQAQIAAEQPAAQPEVVAAAAAGAEPVVSEETKAPVRRRSRAASAVQQADDAAVTEAGSDSASEQAEGGETPAPRSRRVLRPRRTTRAVKAEADAGGQDPALADTE